MRIKIMIDFDGVLADFEGTFRRKYNNLISKFGNGTEKELDFKVTEYNMFENGLDNYFVQKAMESFSTYDMKVNGTMIEFIKKLNENNIDYRIVTAREYRQSETLKLLEKMFEVPRHLVWFVPTKENVLELFENIIEDNPAVTGDNVYMVAHKYNEKVTNVKFRGSSKQIVSKLSKELKLK